MQYEYDPNPSPAPAAVDTAPEHRRVMPAGRLTGEHVRNHAGEAVGTIEEIIIDIPTGRVAYVVIAFGGFLGIGDKLLAVPWSVLEIDRRSGEILLDVARKELEEAPGIDPDNWPETAADAGWS